MRTTWLTAAARSLRVATLPIAAVALPAPLLAQQTLLPGSGTPAISVDNGRVFFSDGSAEFCTSQRLRSMSTGGGAVPTLVTLSGCPMDARFIDASGAYVFIVKDNGISRAWSGGPSAGLTPIVTPPADTFSLVQEIEAVGDWVYWASPYAVGRVSRNGDTPTQLPRVTNFRNGMTPAPNGFVYWTEGGEGTGIIRRGNLETLFAETVRTGLNSPSNIVADDTRLYWSEPGGVVRSGPLTTGGIVVTLRPAPAGGYNVTSLIIDDVNIYWLESTNTGVTRIFKVPKAGGSAQQIGPGNLSFARTLQQDTDQLYWVEGNNGDIRRIRKDAAAIQPDFSWLGLEVTQGIQNISNGVPIVQGKPTLVRGYPRSTIANYRNVVAQLTGVRTSSGAPLPGSPLRSTVPTLQVGSDLLITDATRRSLARTFNWEIPDSWLGGDVTLTASLNFDGSISEGITSNNSITRAIDVSSIPPICLKLRRTRTERPPYSVADPTFRPILNRFRSLMPARDIWIFPQDGLFEELDCCTWLPPWVYWDKWEVNDDADMMIVQLIVEETFSGNPSQCNSNRAETHRVAMIGPDVSTGSLGGYANYAWNVNWVKFTSRGSIPFDFPDGGSTLAQEVAHNYNGVFGSRWQHVNCGNPDGINNAYPYNTNTIGPSGATNYYGYDPISRAVIAPNTARDYMSYCGPAWSSDYNWRGIQSVLGLGGLAEPPPPPPPAGDYLLAVGLINHDRTSAIVRQVFRLPAGTIPTPRLTELLAQQAANTTKDPAFALDLRNAAGALISTVPFDAGEQAHEHGQEQSVFSVLAPDDQNAPSVTVRSIATGGSIGARSASASSPVISAITSPLAGQSFTTSLPISWTASDADGDFLTYVVQYSNDNGVTWNVLSSNAPQSSLTISPITDLPGSPTPSAPNVCRVRIIASDGFRTAIRTSDAFSVSNRPPVATITEPADGTRYGAGQSIRLRGSAYDAEDGQILTPASFSWQVTGLSSIAGNETILPAGLAPGTYSVVLTARDARSNPDTDMITIYVEDGPPPDADSDNDGVLDVSDNCPLTSNPDQADADADGIGDVCDNCPNVANPDQGDNNVDGVGNACDIVRYYVKQGATGLNNGLSWPNAFTTLEAALAACDSNPSVGEIWIAQGRYVPTARTVPADPRSATFRLRPHVSLRGGFFGDELHAHDAEPRRFRTVLSGDRSNNDTPAFGNRTDNVYTVLTSADAVAEDTVLDGLVVSGGNASATAQAGGLHLFSTTPIIKRCDFISNQASTSGGALSFSGSAPLLLSHSRFYGNSAASIGGAVFASGGTPMIVYCLFTGNTTTGGTSARGGAFGASNATPAFVHCTFASNTTTGLGGGIHLQGSANAALGVNNSILYFNADSTGQASLAQLRANGGATISCAYSCVQGDFAGPGNIGANPQFTNLNGPDSLPGTPDDQARPQQGSPTSDAGATPYATAILVDLDGLPRADNDRARTDTGVGPAPIVDMGVYELPRCAADWSRDGALNSQDFFEFVTDFFTPGADSDFNHDGANNSQDFFDFLQAFFIGCA
jgi:hypothetical protein